MTADKPYRLGGLLPALGMAVPALAAEFPAYDIGMQQTYGGPALVAVRRDGAAMPGTYAVITSDPREMRDALGCLVPRGRASRRDGPREDA
jgi:hypothetical protein